MWRNAEGIPTPASYPPLHELDVFRSGEYRNKRSESQETVAHAFLKQAFPEKQKAAV